jgi:hypothetical protein
MIALDQNHCRGEAPNGLTAEGERGADATQQTSRTSEDNQPLELLVSFCARPLTTRKPCGVIAVTFFSTVNE